MEIKSSEFKSYSQRFSTAFTKLCQTADGFGELQIVAASSADFATSYFQTSLEKRKK